MITKEHFLQYLQGILDKEKKIEKETKKIASLTHDPYMVNFFSSLEKACIEHQKKIVRIKEIINKNDS